MSKALSGPIPGQSLTDEPKGFPWERPPETAQPEEALMMHIDKMSKPEFLDATTFMLQMGIPVEVITNTTMTMAVANGIHSIDTGLIIAPVIHKKILSIADESGLDYEEFFPEDEEQEQASKDRIKALVLQELNKDRPIKGEKIVSETVAAMGSAETEEFEDMRDEESNDDETAFLEQEMPEGTGMGLMSKEA